MKCDQRVLHDSDAQFIPVSEESPRSVIGALSVRIGLLNGFVLIASVCWYYGWLHNPRLGAENGPLEWAQVGALGCAALMSLYQLFRSKLSVPRVGCLAAAMLYISLSVRELDIGDFPVEGARSIERGVRMATVAGWMALLCWAARRRKPLGAFVRSMLPSWSASLLMAGLALYLVTWPFDHVKFTEKNTLRFMEELIEFHATIIMLLSALTSPAALARGAAAQPVDDGD